MHWIVFALGAALSWGLYGPSLHAGQTKLGSPFRALLCVGIAYFIVGVIVPVVALAAQGQLGMKGWSASGFTQATLAGGLGATGAVCIIYAFRAGGLPTYVMPLVFGGAPLVNVLFRCPCTRRRSRRIRSCGSASPSSRGRVAGAVLQTARIATPRPDRFSVRLGSSSGSSGSVQGSAAEDLEQNPGPSKPSSNP